MSFASSFAFPDKFAPRPAHKSPPVSSLDRTFLPFLNAWPGRLVCARLLSTSVVCLRQPSPVELCPKIYVVCCLRFFSYWYRALGRLVTEMESGTTADTVVTAAGGQSDAVGGVARSSSNRGTLVAASLGGAKRCAILYSLYYFSVQHRQYAHKYFV